MTFSQHASLGWILMVIYIYLKKRETKWPTAATNKFKRVINNLLAGKKSLQCEEVNYNQIANIAEEGKISAKVSGHEQIWLSSAIFWLGSANLFIAVGHINLGNLMLRPVYPDSEFCLNVFPCIIICAMLIRIIWCAVKPYVVYDLEWVAWPICRLVFIHADKVRKDLVAGR